VSATLKRHDIASAIELVLDNFFLIQKDIDGVTGLYHAVIREAERTLIRRVMHVTDRNKKIAARILGISRNTLNTKIRNLNLE
jgi:DNA-binding protein Fis